MAYGGIRAVALFRLLLFDIEVTDCDLTRTRSIYISEKIFSYICHDMMLYFYHNIYMM